MAEFAYNNNEHTTTGVSPNMANYGYHPNFAGIPSSTQCVPEVEHRLLQIKQVQEELKYSIEAAQEAKKQQFDKKVKTNPRWNEGEEVWLSSRNITTTRASPKLLDRWLGPFLINSQISPSAYYKLTLPPSMKGVHPVFQISMLRKHTTDQIEGRRRAEPGPIIVDGEEEWEVDQLLDCRKRGRGREFLVEWKGFGPDSNSWEPETNLSNSKELIDKFDKKFPTATNKYKKRRRRK
ncbi:hypothetical protein PSTG_11706 [Puccinia striiformis f. sp. tritici PST-78]|uniref:Chromo domain-containing protein n=1 Tax=Puccinia striiformis f. sp. tritici PST-78 TaxID=1165861 RepID=A0A0L0V7R3_9BASI|nr:hypothetical protein PSTG_11706 [Puccinia striiformis f. sp. tritici PST-78]